MRGLDQVNQFFIAEQIGADLRYPGNLGTRVDDISQQRLGALDVNGKVVVDEKDNDLTPVLTRVFLQSQELTHHALVGTKPNRVAKESRDRAELTTVRTTTT